MARAPRDKFRGAPLDPKGSSSSGVVAGKMRQGHPTPPTFQTRKQQKQWYKAQYKNGVVARGTGVVTTYKRGRLVKSNAGAKTLSQKKVNVARRRHRVNMVKRTAKGAVALGGLGITAYAAAQNHPATAARTKAFGKSARSSYMRNSATARGRYAHTASTMKTKRNLRRMGGGGGRQRRDRRGRFS